MIVLEGAEEVGGRTRSPRLREDIVEMGAEWVGRGHRQLMALLAELRIATRPARQPYLPIRWRGSETTRLLVPRAPARELVAVPQVIWQARKLANYPDPSEPRFSPAAPRLDQISFAEGLRSVGIRQETYLFFDKIVGALSSTPIDRLSLLHVLWWIRRGQGPLRALCGQPSSATPPRVLNRSPAYSPTSSPTTSASVLRRG